MPEKPLTVLTYAASASLAAVALVYFFNPNYLIDGDSSTTSASTRKKGVVGLFNPANDCFINCILQSLAGLGDLRLYLIREMHRRDLGGPSVYASVPLVDANGKAVNEKTLYSLQGGEVTKGMKDILDKLNERPIYKKTISAANFIRVLELAFGTRIAKSQQDAQELLQIVAERLSEEYHAGKEARRRAKKLAVKGAVSEKDDLVNGSPQEAGSEDRSQQAEQKAVPDEQKINEGAEKAENDDLTEEEDGFPLEGQTEARTECQECRFVPKPNPTSFVMLNLMVPQKNSTTLNECFDAHFKTEFIDDYVCDKCRLEHALEVFRKNLAAEKSEELKVSIKKDIDKVQNSLEEDPEKAPEGVKLPDTKLAPKRKIARYVEITKFPKILITHLSRSIFDPRSSSTKNLSKLSFPERLPVGGLLNRRNYKLLGVVTHKGTHNNGHYETFRRQHLYAPFSNPHLDRTIGPYSQAATPDPSSLPSPRILPKTAPEPNEIGDHTASPSAAEMSSMSAPSVPPSPPFNSLSPPSTRPSSGSTSGVGEKKSMDASVPEKPSTSLHGGPIERVLSRDSKPKTSTSTARQSSLAVDASRFKLRKKPADRWWRISDDKVKECKTSDVLSMQKEVYMLFYEMERG